MAGMTTVLYRTEQLGFHLELALKAIADKTEGE
jgi:hypothetical protein